MKKMIKVMAVLIWVCIHASPTLAQFITVPGVGTEAQGAGIALTNLNANPRPEMILMAYDNPPGANTFRYKIGWDLNTNGVTANWSNHIEVPGVGWEAQGAGIAITNLDVKSRPEMILMACDNPPGDNNFRYKIGWNLDNNGAAESWSNHIEVPGVGWEAQGAGVAITNLDGDWRPEMILMAYDNPSGANTFRYRIGWNLDSKGIATKWSGLYTQVSGVGWEAQGADIAIASLDPGAAGKLELILMAYDNPPEANNFRYTIGWDLNSLGIAAKWQKNYIEVPGIGWEAQGAGIAIMNIDEDAWPEVILMAYDNPPGPNTFRYQVSKIQFSGYNPRAIHLEIDKLNSVAWPPAGILRDGATHTLRSIYALAAIDLQSSQNEGTIADIHPGMPYTDAELDNFRVAHMNNAGPAGTWHVHGACLTRHVDGALGTMFDTGDRRAFAVFANAIGGNDRYLRTVAHELGHALNLLHSDSDNWPPSTQGQSIMNQTGNLAADWNYCWSAASLHHFYNHPEYRWRPQSGLAFTQCHP